MSQRSDAMSEPGNMLLIILFNNPVLGSVANYPEWLICGQCFKSADDEVVGSGGGSACCRCKSYGCLVHKFGGLSLRNLSVLAISALMLASFEHSASAASVGVGNPYPVSNYTCEDGTRLAVRLLGEAASVSINDATEVELPAVGSDGTTYSNGQYTVTIVQGQLSWGVGQAVPSACTGG